MGVVDAAYGHPLKLEEEAVAYLAGGIASNGYQCGMLWGAALAAGAQAYRLFGNGAQAEIAAILASQRLLDSFRSRAKNETDCIEITNLNFKGKIETLPILKFIFKGGPIRCFRMAGDYAPKVFAEINATFLEENFEVPDQL